ncbi:hypothetical protein DN752_08145 [Echinicola strongylocentroti]|uniref:Lipoprotein n=1 Tax=Echinicola strongylocentroti TaxID=1795355 RepID=A0A2Z4IHW7_9BACT|nr:hypothetical protein [Echinicola strongylocentroti]AWW30098.1 hypothetical protein DN752_08145 [Echinicola strongylocentroti]
MKRRVNFKPIWLFFLVFIVVGSCISYKYSAPLDLNEVKLDVPIKITEITIDDNRDEISKEDDIKIPAMTGLKKKSWRHYPKLSNEHRLIIDNAIKNNFSEKGYDSATIVVDINYASKEFEQTGMTEIERVYLNVDTKITSSAFEYYASSIDTFYYESINASNQHFEEFYQNSLQNNMLKNIIRLRDQYYNSPKKESECFDSSYSKSIQIDDELKITVYGKEMMASLEVSGQLQSEITQNWDFKISTNQDGLLTYIEPLNVKSDGAEELGAVIDFLHSIKVIKAETNNPPYHNCWKLSVIKSTLIP